MISAKNNKIARAYKGVEVITKAGEARTIDVGFDKRGHYREINYSADKTQAYFGKFVSQKYVLAHLDKKVEEKNRSLAASAASKLEEKAKDNIIPINSHPGFFDRTKRYATTIAAATSIAIVAGLAYTGCSKKESYIEPSAQRNTPQQVSVQVPSDYITSTSKVEQVSIQLTPKKDSSKQSKSKSHKQKDHKHSKKSHKSIKSQSNMEYSIAQAPLAPAQPIIDDSKTPDKHYTNVKGLSLTRESEYVFDEQTQIYRTKRRAHERALIDSGKTSAEAKALTATNTYFTAHSTTRTSVLKENKSNELYEIESAHAPRTESDRTHIAQTPTAKRNILGDADAFRIYSVSIDGSRNSEDNFNDAGKHFEKAGKNLIHLLQPETMSPEKNSKKAGNSWGDFLWNTLVQLPYSVASLVTFDSLPKLNDKTYQKQPFWFRPFVYAGRTPVKALDTGVKTADIPTFGVTGSIVSPLMNSTREGIGGVGDVAGGIVNAPRTLANHNNKGFENEETLGNKVYDLLPVSVKLGSDIIGGKGLTDMIDDEKTVNEQGFLGSMLKTSAALYLLGSSIDELATDNGAGSGNGSGNSNSGVSGGTSGGGSGGGVGGGLAGGIGKGGFGGKP